MARAHQSLLKNKLPKSETNLRPGLEHVRTFGLFLVAQTSVLPPLGALPVPLCRSAIGTSVPKRAILERDNAAMRPPDEKRRPPRSGAVVNAERGAASDRRNQFRGFNWEAWLANKKRYLNSCLKCNFPSA